MGTELTAMNCLSVHQTIAYQCATIQCSKQESGTLRLNFHFSHANLLNIQLAILVKHQIRVLNHYEGQFFESLTLPLRELYSYTEIYRRVIDSKTAFFSFLFLLFLCLFVFQAFKNHLIAAKADESYYHCECMLRLQKFELVFLNSAKITYTYMHAYMLSLVTCNATPFLNNIVVFSFSQ